MEKEELKDIRDDVPSEFEKAPETLFEAYWSYRTKDEKGQAEKYVRSMYLPYWLWSQYTSVADKVKDDYGYKYASSTASLFSVGVRFGAGKLFEEYDNLFVDLYDMYAKVNTKIADMGPFDSLASLKLRMISEPRKIIFLDTKRKNIRLYLRSQGIASRLGEVLAVSSNAILVLFALKAMTLVGREDCQPSVDGCKLLIDSHFTNLIVGRKHELEVLMNGGEDSP